MAADGTLAKSGDPVLDAALSEMHSEGVLDDSGAPTGSDPAPADAAPLTVDAGASPDAAADPTAGDAAPLTDPVDPAAVDPAKPADPTDDPLAGTEPLTYTVNGQPVTFEGIYEIKGQGGLIPPDKLDAVRERLAVADTATAQARHWYGVAQEYERQGGPAKLQQLTEDLATVNAAGGLLAPFFVGKMVQNADGTVTETPPDVQTLLGLLQQNEDGSIGWNERARGLLVKELLLSTKEAKQTLHADARSEDQRQRDEATHAAQDVEAFRGILAQYKAALPDLTDDDLQKGGDVWWKARATLFRQAGAADKGMALGTRMIDPTAMNDWFTERAAWRAGQKAKDTTTTKAGAFNAGQDRGRQPVRGTKPAATVTTAVADATAKPSKQATWSTLLEQGLAEIGAT